MWILELPLKKKWYDLIESGIKKEEYRELKPFWMKRIFDCPRGLGTCIFVRENCSKCLSWCSMSARSFTHVKFRYGYTTRYMTYEINNISIGIGNPNWGAPDSKVIIIKIGRLCDI